MPFRKYLAYTLVEILVTVSIIGGLAGGAYVIVQNVRESSANAKLEQDVQQINRSIQLYQTHGGRIASGLTGDQVLALLRRTAQNPFHPGLKGKMIDSRMSIRWQAPNEIYASTKRAYWNDTAKRFEIAEAGSTAGVREFYLGDEPEPLPAGVVENGVTLEANKDARAGLHEFDPSTKWVWNYDAGNPVDRSTPDIIPTVGVDPGTSEPQVSGDAVPLAPPNFSEVTGRYDISWFPGTITLSLPSSVPANAGEIYYHTPGGQWTKYTAPVTVEPGVSIWAKTVSLDLDRYMESAERVERYDQKAMKLEIAGQFAKNTFSYKELGGAMQGVAALVPPFAPISVTNLEGVPESEITSAKFQIYWTYDGSDPVSSASRQSGPVFTGTFSPVSIGLGVGHYNAAGSANIRVRAVALDTEAYANSDELTLAAGRVVTQLPATTLTLNSDKVVMSSNEADGTLPAGSRIFYNATAADPGDIAGEPAPGATLYTGPVTFPTGVLTEYNARTYAPAEYKDWFTAGPPSSIGTGTTPDGYYFAVGGGDGKLYQFDSLSGTSIVRTSECPFPPAAVAYLGTSGRVYYVEQASGAWRLGMYDLAGGSHTVAGQLNGPGLDFIASTQPRNLVASGNSLYYVVESTDDLIRVDFNTNGTIRAQYKYADMTDDTVAFTNIGDITTDNSQNLYLAASNAFGSFNLSTLASYSVPVMLPSQVWTGLVASTSGALYGVSSAEPGKLYSINKTNATGSNPVNFTPARSFDDFGGPVNDVLAAPAPGHFAVSAGHNNIYRLNLQSGRQTIFADIEGYNPSAIAHDRAGGVFYTLGSLASAPAELTLGRYTISSGAFTPLGSLNAGGQGYIPTSMPGALTWFNGGLYYVAPGTDDLVKITPAGPAFTQAKVDDINDNNSLPSVDAMSIGSDGELYLASKNDHWLASYGVASGGGLSVLKSSAESRYDAVTFAGNGVMYGVPSSTPATRQQLFSIDDNDGIQTFAKNILPPVEFSDITGWFDSQPAPLTDNYFAVDGSTSRIYRFNPATGASAVLTSSAPWALGTVAYDNTTQKVYYTQAGGFAVGVYNIAADTHTLIGSLNTPSFANPASDSPQNLTFFNGSLYYVALNSDDLIRVELKSSGEIADVWKDDDLNGDVSIGNVGDIAVNASGMMYLTSPAVFARYNLLTLSGFTVLNAAPSASYASLFLATGGAMNGTRLDDPSKFQSVNLTTGAPTLTFPILPFRRFVDAASTQPVVAPPSQAGAFYATANGRKAIYRLDLTTGDLSQITGAAPSEPEALAFDPVSNVIYYSVTGSTELYKYDINGRLHTLLGSLSSAPGASITEAPRNLTFFLGNLYTIPLGDDLIRIELTGSSVTGLTKIGDVSGNTKNIGNAGALAVDNTGIAWVASDNANLLGKFNFYARSGYYDVNTSTSRFNGLTFDSSNVLHGAETANPNKINSVSQVNGALTFVANTSPNRNLKDISGINHRPIPLLPECYAVGGGNKNIYQFDPATGANFTITSDAPFNLNAIARDPARDMLYYIEHANTNWRLGRYDVANHTHAIMATLGSGSWTNVPPVRPNNLFCWDGNLFFILPNSDDLYQISLNTSGTAVTAMAKVDDISFSFTIPALNFPDTGDVAVGTDANANFSGGGGFNGYFRMFSHKETVSFPPQTQNWRGLLINAAGTLYGSKDSEETRIYQIQRGTGAESGGVDSFPSIVFWDMAGEEPSRPVSASNSLWAVSETTGHLGEFLNWNLINVVARDWGVLKYYSNGTATSFTGGYRIESLAVDDTGMAYFVRNVPTTVNGTVYKKALFKLNTAALTWGTTPTPPVATFVGDLEQALSVLGTVSATAGSDDITGLAIGFDWKLYALYNRGTGADTDYLLRINSLHTTGSGALSNISVIGQIVGAAGEASTGGQDLCFSAGSLNTLYVTDDTDDKVYGVNYRTAAITEVLSTDAAVYEGLASYNTTGELLGSNANTASPANAVRTINSGAGNDSTRFNSSTISGGALADIEGLSFPRGPLDLTTTEQMPPVFAVDRSTRIYRVNPATGVTTIETGSALFNADAVAYDAATATVFYVENSDATIRLAKYSNGAHTLIGDLKLTGAYTPTSHPQHLIHYGDSLYYINNGTGSLVRVQLNTAATAIAAQTRAAVLSSTANWTVTAAALDNNGILYFHEGTNLRTFDLRNRMSLTAPINTGSNRDSVLHVSATGAFYAADSGTRTRVSLLNSSTGATTTFSETTPAVNLYDMAGGSTAPPPVFVDTTNYVTDGSANIFMLDPVTGQNAILTTTPLFSNIAAVACNAAGTKVYYIQQGTPYKLGLYDRATDTHTLLQSLQTDPNYSVATQPQALTWFNNHLYFIPQNTDNLGKVELNAAGGFLSTVQIADIANNDAAFGTVGDIAVDNTGWLFIAGSASFAKYNVASLSGYQSLASNPASVWTGLMIGTDGTSLFGTRAADSTFLYAIDKTNGAAGASPVALSPARSANDLAAPLQPIPAQLAGQRYMITWDCWSLFRLDLNTGADYAISESLSGQPSAVAHAYSAGIVYMLVHSPSSSSPYFNDIWLESYNLNTGFVSQLGSIRASGLAYQATAIPHALLYAGDKLYYVHPQTDDLVEISLNAGRTAVASAAKVADMNANTSLGDVDALTFGPDGTLYISRSDQPYLASYNFRQRSNLTVIKSSAPAAYNALSFSDAGILHGVSTAANRDLYTVNTSSGTPTFKVSGWNQKWDVTGLSGDNVTVESRPVYAVVKDNASNSVRLVRFNNYAGSPVTVTNFGNLTYNNGSAQTNFPLTGAPVDALTVASNGTAYIVASGDLVISGTTYRRPLFTFNVNSLSAGSTVPVTLVGDLEPRLRSLLGSSGYLAATEPVSGLAIHPGNGGLYALVQKGTVADTDFLVRINDLAVSGGNINDIAAVGPLSGSPVNISHGADLAFSASGTLYVNDANTGKLLVVDPADGSVDSAYSVEWPAGASYAALACNPQDSDIIAADGSKIRRAAAGDGNDSDLFNYTSLFNLADCKAMSFSTYSVTFTPTPTTQYFAANGTTTLYSFGIPSALTAVVTTGCLFPAATVAYDPASNVLYYTENAASGFRLAKYSRTANTHTLLGTLGTKPTNLEFYGGSLYFVQSNSDDLIRVDLNSEATSIAQQWKIADITADSSTFGNNVTDLAIDKDGIAYLSAVDGLHKYDLVRLNGYQLVKSGAQYAGVVFAQNGTDLYGTSFAQQTRLFSINKTVGDGTMTEIATSNPAVTFEDFAGYPPDAAAAVGGSSYAVNGTRTLYKFDPLTGAVQAVSAAAPYNMAAVAYDYANDFVYYIEDVSSNWRLGRYSVASGVHTNLGNATTPLTTAGVTFGVAQGNQPNNLFCYNSQVYYIAPGSDDLVQIQLNNAGSSISCYYKVADISGNSVSFSSVGDVVEGATTVYFAVQDSNSVQKICSFNMNTLSSFADFITGTSAARDWRALTRLSGTIYGIASELPATIYSGSGLATAGAGIAGGLQFKDFATSAASTAQTLRETFMTTTASPAIFNLGTVYGSAGAGVLRLITASCPFNVSGIAYDQHTSSVWYTENSGTSLRIGRYDLVRNVHTGPWNLNTGWTYNATAGSKHLVYYLGDLYYIHPGTDDLVRVALSNGAPASVTKWADITGDRLNLGTVEAASIDGNGFLRFARAGVAGATRYNMMRRSGYDVTTSNTQNHTAIIYGERYNSSSVTDGLKKVFVGSLSTGSTALSISLNPALEAEEFSVASPVYPHSLPADRYYATNRTTQIFEINPATGVTQPIPWNGNAGMNLEGIAYDYVNDFIYYLEAPGQGFRLGRYDAGRQQHTTTGNLQTGRAGYTPAQQPRSMVFFDRALYYIAPGTDDLVRVVLGETEITTQQKVADISNNAQTFDATAMSLKNNGTLFFVSSVGGTGSFYSYNLLTLPTSVTQLATSIPVLDSLVFSQDSTTLYGSSVATPDKVGIVNTSSGILSSLQFTAPRLDIAEITGMQSVPATPSANAVLYAANGTKTLYRVNGVSGAVTTVATWSTTGNYKFESLAWDRSGGVIYFTEAGASSAANTRLGKYTISTNTFASIGTFGFVTKHLIWYKGGLYYVRSGTDSLYSVSLTAPATQTLVGTVNSGVNPGTITAAGINEAGVVYYSTAKDTPTAGTASKLGTFNIGSNTPSGPSLFTLSNWYQMDGLAFNPGDGLFYGTHGNTAGDPNPYKIQKVYSNFSGFETHGTYGPAVSCVLAPSTAINFTDLAGGALSPHQSMTVPPVYAIGDFYRTATSDFRNIARFTGNGALDLSFNVGAGFNSGSSVKALTRTANGGVLVGGNFTTYNNIARPSLALIRPDGQLDTTFAPSITNGGNTFTLDWGSVGFAQNATLTGADTSNSSASSATHGLSTSGGFSGFGSQTINNAGGSGVNVTVSYSQNMYRSGAAPGANAGPALYSPSGSGGAAGANPDARVTGPYGLVWTSDRAGTITPATLGISFSEPVYIESMYAAGLGLVNSQAENLLVRAWSGASAGGSLVAASDYTNQSAVPGPLYGTTADPLLDNLATNVIMDTGVSDKLYHTLGNGHEALNRRGRTRYAWTTSTVQSLAASLWAPAYSPGRTIDPARPLGLTQDYAAFAFGSISASGNIAGGVASGGSASLNSITAAGSLNSSWNDKDTLVAGGTVNFAGVLAYGKAAYAAAGTNTFTTPNGSKRVASNVIDFAAEQSALSAISAQWAAQPTTSGASVTFGTYSIYWNRITLDGGNGNGLIVFNLQSDRVNNAYSWNAVNIGSDATVIINIQGDSVNLFNKVSQEPLVISGLVSSRTIFNCASASLFSANGVDVPGTILAPQASVMLSNGADANGTVIASNISVGAGSEIRWMPFGGNDLGYTGTVGPVAKPLGVAQDYGVFTFGDFSMTSGGGSVAYGVATGGNANYTGLTIGTALTSAADGTDQWIVNGSLTTDGNGSLQRGNCAYGSSSTPSLIYVNGGGTKRVATNLLDWNGIRTQVLSRADEWKNMDTTSGASISYAYNAGDGKTAITINAGSLSGLVVVNADAGQFTSVSGLTVQNVAADAVLVVNIPGATPPQWTNFWTSVSGAASNPKKQIIYNFADATLASFNSIQVRGTVLAPRGTVYIGTGGGQFNGNVIANAVDLRSVGTFGGSEFSGSYTASAPAPITPGTTIPTAATAHLSKIVFRKTSGATPGSVWAVQQYTAGTHAGKYIIAGNFSHVNGVARKNIARLNMDGTLDTTFDPGTGPNNEILTIDIRSDGKVHAGGDFTTWNGAAAGAKVVLLNLDGSRDTAFTSPVTATAGSPVNWIKAASTSVAYIGGSFAAPKVNAAKINSSTGVASAWNTGTGPNGVVNTGILTNGNATITLGGNFTSVDGVTGINRLVRISSTGTSFTTTGYGTGFNAAVNALVQLPNSNYVHAGGAFTTHSGGTRTKLSTYEDNTLLPGISPWGPSGMTVTAINNVK